MTTQIFRFGVTLSVHDPSRDTPEVRDLSTGAIIRPAGRFSRTVAAGEPVELSVEIGETLLRIHGPIETFDARQMKIETGNRAYRDQCAVDSLAARNRG